MVQVYAVVVYDASTPETPYELWSNFDLSKISFFQRSSAKEFIRFHARTVVSRTQVNSRQTVQFESNLGKCYSFVKARGPQLLGCAVITDLEYPMRVAFGLSMEVLTAFENKFPAKLVLKDETVDFPDGDKLMAQFQNPAEADKMSKITRELEEVRNIVIKSMDDLMKRGETLDTLMQKSNDLSEMSRQFYRTAKKNNQCCSAL
jgi:synaptobrevin homolog YKT6